MEGIVHEKIRKKDLILENVAYVSGFHTNIISRFLLWKELKIWHCSHMNELVKGDSFKKKITSIIPVKSMYRQLVIKYKPFQSYFSALRSTTMPFRIPRSDCAVFILPAIQTAPRQPCH